MALLILPIITTVKGQLDPRMATLMFDGGDTHLTNERHNSLYSTKYRLEKNTIKLSRWPQLSSDHVSFHNIPNQCRAALYLRRQGTSFLIAARLL